MPTIVVPPNSRKVYRYVGSPHGRAKLVCETSGALDFYAVNERELNNFFVGANFYTLTGNTVVSQWEQTFAAPPSQDWFLIILNRSTEHRAAHFEVF